MGGFGKESGSYRGSISRTQSGFHSDMGFDGSESFCACRAYIPVGKVYGLRCNV